MGNIGNSWNECCCDNNREMELHLKEGGGPGKFVLFYHDVIGTGLFADGNKIVEGKND